MKKILSLLSLCACLQLTGNEIQNWSSPPEVISTSGVDASDPHTAIDGSGNAVAVWVENNEIISKNKPVAGDWGSSSLISGSGASSPRVVADSAGNATAVWVENGVIKTAAQPFGSAWGTASALSTTGSSSPQIAIDSAGNTVAVWVTSGVVQSATKLFGGSWSATPDVLSASASAAPQVCISDDHTVVAIWHTLNGTSNLYNVDIATKTSLSGTWSVASTISNPSLNSVYPQIAIDSTGNTFAIWYRYNLAGNSYSDVVLQGAMLIDGSPWSTPVDISNPGMMNPAELSSKLKCNPMAAIALWTNSYDGSSFSVETSSTDHSQTWQAPMTLLNTLYSFGISMNINSEGDVFGLYMNYDKPSTSILIDTIETHLGGFLDGTWTNPLNISTGTINAFPHIAPVLVGGTNNYASALWAGYNGTNTVILSSFGTGTVINPPSNVAVVQTVNNFHVFNEYVNTVTWTASSDPNLIGYGIYRNAVYLTFIPAGTLQFVDDNQLQNGPVTYSVSAIDTTGTESALVSVSLP